MFQWAQTVRRTLIHDPDIRVNASPRWLLRRSWLSVFGSHGSLMLTLETRVTHVR